MLVTVASVLREAVRETDLVARIGGDEFAIVLHDAAEHDAQTLASLIGDVMAAQRFGFDAHASVSASVGVATFGPDLETTPDALVADADSAMYRAKGASPVGQRGGRRRTD